MNGLFYKCFFNCFFCTILFGQEKYPLPEKQVTIELLLVEYIHRDGFNWGIDILSAQKGKFGQTALIPGELENSITTVYDISKSLKDKFKINLQALVEDNDAKILQNPRITVQNTQTGNIDITEDKYIQLQTSSMNGLTTNLEKIQAGVRLKISPTILSDSLLNIVVEGSISEFISLSDTGGDYVIETNNINTQVTIKENNTLVIGGMIKREFDNYESGIRFLRKVPILKYLFTRIEKRMIQKEMVLYLTAFTHQAQQEIEYDNLLINNSRTKNSINK